MTKTVAFIQARMSSNRFPGKVVEPVLGRPMIVFMVERARRAKALDDVVVVTSTDSSDNVLADVLKAADIPVFRGDLHDVLGRYAQAAEATGATEIVRLTGDCPLIDPAVVDLVVNARRHARADYSSNIDPPTYPDGLDVECFTRAALMRAQVEASSAADREHVTVWMRTEQAGLSRVNHRAIADFSRLRLTVDYPSDLETVRQALRKVTDPLSCDLYDVLRSLAPGLHEVSRKDHNHENGR